MQGIERHTVILIKSKLLQFFLPMIIFLALSEKA